MKKKVLFIVILLFMILALFSQVNAQHSDIEVVIHGQVQKFEVPPLIIEGRTLVPMRHVFEAFNATLNWNGLDKSIMVTKAHRCICLIVGSTTASVDGEKVEIDVPPIIIEGRVLVPLRFASESLGVIVDWDSVTRTVTLIEPEDLLVLEKIKVMDSAFGCMITEEIFCAKDESALGKATITIDELMELDHRNPESFENKLNSVLDVYNYINSKKMEPIGNQNMLSDGIIWRYNIDVESAIKENIGNCGIYSEMAKYFLDDVYDEIGYIHYIHDKGGHVINYIIHNDSLYTFDLSLSCLCVYRFDSFDNLVDYFINIRKVHNNQISSIASIQSGTVFAVHVERDSDKKPVRVIYPLEIKDDIMVLYSGDIVSFLPFPYILEINKPTILKAKHHD